MWIGSDRRICFDPAPTSCARAVWHDLEQLNDKTLLAEFSGAYAVALSAEGELLVLHYVPEVA